MDRRHRCFRKEGRHSMFHSIAHSQRRFSLVLVCMALLSLLVTACALQPGSVQTHSAGTTAGGTPSASASSGGTPSFPTTPPALRTPSFSNGEQIAPTVKVLASVDPTLIIQFPLSPSGIKALFPKASGLVTVMQGNPAISVFDTITVNVQNMPPNVKFTVFRSEEHTSELQSQSNLVC